MQLAELADRSRVSIPSIKYYLREGLLPPGERTGRSRASYDDDHLQRLRLIRALVEAGGLSLSEVRAVLDSLDSQPSSVHEVFGAALGGEAAHVADDDGRAARLVADLGWAVEPDCAPMADLASALAALEDGGLELSDEHLVELGRRVEPVAALEIDSIPLDSPAEVLRYVVLGTVLVRPVILALRELAHQDASQRRFDGLSDSPT